MYNRTLLNASNTLELIKYFQGDKNHKLNKQEKIAFAYRYWLLNPQDMTELYEDLAKEYSKQAANMAKKLGEFMYLKDITKFKVFTDSLYEKDLDHIMKITSRIANNGNWLSQYHLDDEFELKSNATSPIIFSYIKPDKTIYTIDKERAQDILGILKENEIPTAKCIVTGSFPYYAHDNIDTYIKKLKK